MIAVYGVAAGVALLLAWAAGHFWHHHKAHRGSAWLIAVSGFLACASVLDWRNALAATVSGGPGLLAFTLVLSTSAFGMYHQAVLKTSRHGYGRIKTPVTAFVFGTAAMLALGEAPRLLHWATASPAATGVALGRSVSQIGSGQAAAAAHHQDPRVILGLAVAAVVVVIVLMRRHEHGGVRGKGGGGSRQAGSGARMIGGGG